MPETSSVLVEAEKSALALTAWSERTGVKSAPIAMGGCWGWRGRIGKVVTSDGQRVDEKGSLADLAACLSREVIPMLDSNVSDNSYVRRAQRELVATLVAMDAKVRIATAR